jgi:hypothetical protein
LVTSLCWNEAIVFNYNEADVAYCAEIYAQKYRVRARKAELAAKAAALKPS